MDVAVTSAIFALRGSDRETALALPFVCGIYDPYAGLWTLSGGSNGGDEDLADAATNTFQVGGRHLPPRFYGHGLASALADLGPPTRLRESEPP